MQALGLGADAVLLGRPVLHGLALDGQQGVEDVINTLKAELKLNMALAGESQCSAPWPSKCSCCVVPTCWQA